MRKTSFGLGLAGTIIAFAVSLLLLMLGILFSVVNTNVDWNDVETELDSMEITIDEDDLHINAQSGLNGVDIDLSDQGNIGIVGNSDFPNMIFGIFSAWFYISSACLFVSGIFGIIGIVITKKRRSVAAGVLLLIASILCIPSLYGLHATALFIPAGILAFLKDKNMEADMIPPQEGAAQ